MTGAERSRKLLADRVAAIPQALERAIADDEVERTAAAFGPPSELTIVGAGGSAGPATTLAHWMRKRGWRPSLAPLSRFAIEPTDAPAAGALCVVSQGLSPNARLALSHRHRFERTLLLTAADKAPGGVSVVRHGPNEESGMLVRVIGPALATLAAVRLAQPGLGLDALPERVAEARLALPDFDAPIILLTTSETAWMAAGIRHKLLETVGEEPPVWDVLQFAHGPFQSWYERRALCLVLSAGSPGEARVSAGLDEMLVPSRHRVVRLESTLTGALGYFERDMQVNRLILQLLDRRPRDLIDWPGKGDDGALYGIDSPGQ